VIWDPENECRPREELEALQLERLRESVARAYARVAHYRQAFDRAGVGPEDVQRLSDIRHFPFLTKDELRPNYPYGMLAVPLEEVARIHASSGTTGQPTVVGYTRADLDTWAELVARIATAGGLEPGDLVHIAFGYGLFTGGFGLHYGVERVGAGIVPVSSGNTRRQVMLLRDLGATALVCTPSYALHIAEVAEGMGISPGDLRLRWGLFGAEPWSEEMREDIEGRLGIQASDNYGLTEVIGPGVSGECVEYKDGLHINEDHFLVEVIDPATGRVLPDGEQGELVFTTLTKEALPIIRYRTRDIASLTREPCPCGRTLARMSRVLGRTDDMIIVRGVNTFPSQVESLLLEVDGTRPNYQIVLDRRGHMDTMEVVVEASEAIFHDEMKGMDALRARIENALASGLGLRVEVRLVEPNAIPKSEGKAQRVVDRRRE
jgi:phenylacetate-CoA ligase